MNPLGAAITLALCVTMLVGPRHWAATAIIAGVCYITQGQEIYIGFHFTAIRLILLAGLIRVSARGELKQLSLGPIDRALIAYAIYLSAIPTIREGNLDELIYQIGSLYNILLSYFVCRALIKGEDDLLKILSLLAIVLLPFALLLIREAITGSNIFAVFSGVAENSLVRDGHVRAQAAFRSPITTGAFGATCAMLFACLFFARIYRWTAIIGMIISFCIVICARSSGPMLGLGLGLLSLTCWPFKLHTRKIRWGIVVTLVGLHLVMKVPVWFLLGRISDVVGGGGYHRAYLIDQFVNHTSSWLLAGTNDTRGWMATELVFGGADLTNQFVSDGVNAGLVCVILSIALLVRCFQGVGKAMTAIHGCLLEKEKLLWGLGSTLVCSIGILFSVTYFDQMHVVWYFLLACLASVTQEVIIKDWVSPKIREMTAVFTTQAEHTMPT